MLAVSQIRDAVVVGSGPAGLAAASALAEEGLQVACMAPSHNQRWRPTYSMWADELDAISFDLSPAVERRWDRTVVQVDAQHRIDVHRGYVRLSTHGLQDLLLARCWASGVEFIDDVAGGYEVDGEQLQIRSRSGIECSGRVLIDATGASSSLVRRTADRNPAFQTAYGELIEVDRHSFPMNEMLLMDYRQLDEGPPTFLYAMPMSETQLFLEETSLAHRPALSSSFLRQRLYQRMHQFGVEPLRVVDREICHIAMGMPMPLRNQRCVAFGAAGSMVHPATGYSIARSLRLAPALARAVADGLAGPRGSGVRASRDAYRAIWPSSQLRAWELYTFGLDSMCSLEWPDLQRFFHAFFRLSPETWQGFHSGTQSAAQVAWAMWKLFLLAPSTLRPKLIFAGTSKGRSALLRAALPGNPL